jgi:hypothetical protein
MNLQHTEGPWRWEFNATSNIVQLVGGRPQFDKTVMDFSRWGVSGATARLRDTSVEGMNLMYRLHQQKDWIAPIPGREHHAHWCAAVVHPDARLIEAAPIMLAALQRASLALAFAAKSSAAMEDDWKAVNAVIAAATGTLK